MGTDISAYAAYGVRVEIDDDRHEYDIDEEIGWSGPVVFMGAGDYDQNMHWLFVRRDRRSSLTVDLGKYVRVDQYLPTDDPYPLWDWQLTDTAERYKLRIVDGPAYFFVPDCS